VLEAIQLHQDLSRPQARALACQMIAAVGIAGPESMLRRYPFELSGGMRQRIMIAMALANDPIC